MPKNTVSQDFPKKMLDMDDVDVMAPGTWENEEGPADWYAVSTPKGIVAYFGDEDAACAFKELLCGCFTHNEQF